jgi:hypothetical protein
MAYRRARLGPPGKMAIAQLTCYIAV